MNLEIFVARRQRFLEAMTPHSVAVFASHPTAIRNSDVEHDYRQDSDFYYLTGFNEPESMLILSNVHPEHNTVMLVRPRNREREIWDGRRAGLGGAVKDFGADAAFSIHEADQHLVNYLEDATSVYVQLGANPKFEAQLFNACKLAKRRHRNRKRFPQTFIDPGVHLHDFRLYKDTHELDAMRRAVEITREAHLAAMENALPGRHEYEVEAALLHCFRRGGSERPAYGSIVGSGPNATILHYRENNRRLEDGDLLLIDAGSEYEYYASDVTRTFPVNGKFTAAQRAIYEIVLRAEEACIAAVQPGTTLDEIHAIAVRVITEGLIDLQLIEGTLEQAIEQGHYKAFYMHRTSHWLGLDVHDVGDYYREGEPRSLEPGQIFTIEPGIYIAEDAEVPEAYRGIGVRIEDDILVTPTGYENLTESIPKNVDELEALLQART